LTPIASEFLVEQYLVGKITGADKLPPQIADKKLESRTEPV
jgi:hypothetical protein